MIYIRNTGSQPLYEQVYEGIKKDIMDGTLKKGTALMPIRKIAEELQVSRNTVSHAYQQLVSEGYLRAVRGSGYFVDDCPETDEIYAVCRPQPVLQPVPKLRCDFRYESISTQLFPWSKWQKYVHQALLKEECSEAISYAPNKGNDALRENLCIYLKTSRGVNCTPEQIVICAGTQFGLQIIASLLPARQYLLAFEEPGYGGMKKVFALSKFAIEPIQVLDDGMDMDAVRQKQCNLLYVTPSHQFPTGVVTSMEKRLEMLQWAEENDAFIIENDYDNEFGYRTQRVPSIQAMDQNGRVTYISMFTKVLSPSIWCAYFVLPKTLLPVYEKRYSFFNAALPTYHQVALADFIHDGLLDEHAREMSVISQRKYALIEKCFAEEGEGVATLMGTPSGTHTLIRIPQCTDQDRLIAYLRAQGIGLYGTKEYWTDQSKAPDFDRPAGRAAYAKAVRPAPGFGTGTVQQRFYRGDNPGPHFQEVFGSHDD